MKYLVLGTLRYLLGLVIIVTIAFTTIAATFMSDAPGAKPFLLAGGFVVGLVISSILFGVVYLLIDIADNTRAAVDLLRAAQGRGMPDGVAAAPLASLHQPDRVEPRL